MTTTLPLHPVGPSPDDAALVAYESVRAEVQALPPADEGRITVNIPTVVTIVRGAQPNIEAEIERIAALPEFDVEALRKLPSYALALLHVYLLLLPSSESESRLQGLVSEASPLRERMLGQAEGLALLGFVDRERVAAIRRGTGHLDTANDLIALAQLFRAGGDELLGKTKLTPAEVARAYVVGMNLVDALGKRRVGTDGAGKASEYEAEYAKLFWLVERTYDQARRALAYLRWSEGDVNEKAPSIYTRRRRSASPAEPPGDEGSAPNDGIDPHVG
jgi:hypothetical protein